MSGAYQFIGWNRQKRLYDLYVLAGLGLYLAVFIIGSFIIDRNSDEMTVMIRAFGTAAFVLLHIVLGIGPLARLDRRYLTFLYNRRHLGVITFFTGLIHALLVVIQYHSGGSLNPIVSIFTTESDFSSMANFPFQPLGVIGLFILFMMAATSHDFWLSVLSPPIWKALHMLVYLAYAALFAHVMFGWLQSESSAVIAGMTALGGLLIIGIHISAGQKEMVIDMMLEAEPAEDGFVIACRVKDLEENRGTIILAGGERIAVFRYDGKVSAISNVCCHQNGPLGEGRIIDGLVTCPWHGFQYDPATGAAPPPFEESVPTFTVRIVDQEIQVNPYPNPAGTYVPPAMILPEEEGS